MLPDAGILLETIAARLSDQPPPATTTNEPSSRAGSQSGDGSNALPIREGSRLATPSPVTPSSNEGQRAIPEPSAPSHAAPTRPVAASPGGFPRPVRDTLEAQIALARQALSPGSVDGVMGSQTRAALLAFQRREGISATGTLDEATRARLSLTTAPLTTHVVTSNDLARLQPLSSTWLGKSRQSALEYETVLELVAEKGRASPNLVRRLNPALNWTNLTVGTVIQIPDITDPAAGAKAAFVVISLAGKTLQAFDARTNLLAHFPCSIAARVEKRPVGELRVRALAPNPDYTFNPEVFPESAEARQIKTKLILPPGPNNPVGTAWTSLDLPGYGIHGTPQPEQVGRTESHGCFRLANWNAEYFLKIAWVGMPVYVEP
ncbi:MAG: peptidoglycan-binding protein [Verrucomicrobia bacterium]|nr:peptidoglycan-binding protein [Verrucomicrobiota bacterium]